jgi:hypothetical protein
MNYFSLCSVVILSLSLITCSTSKLSFEELYELRTPVLEPLKSYPKEYVDDPVKNSEHARFLVWYMIPEEVRKELIFIYYRSDRTKINPCRPPPGMVCIAPDRYNYLTPKQIVEKIQNDRDWYNFANDYVLDAKRFSESTQLNFLAEAIKNASPRTIEEIFQSYPHASVLMKKIQTKESEKLVNFVLDSRMLAGDIIEIFRILERYSDLDMANLGYIQKIRMVAYERDDCELLMYTNAFPDLIRPVSSCQDDLFDHVLKGDNIPRIWSLICDDPHRSVRNQVFTISKDRFIKFRLFSESVNAKAWPLDMYALACQEYELALKVPTCITMKSASENVIVRDMANGINHISQMIPLIPDPFYRQMFIERCNYTSMDSERYLTEFQHLNSSGKKSTVKVVPYCEQQDSVNCYTPPVRMANTDDLISKVLNLQKKNW